MKIAAVLLLSLALGACAEVTTFKRPDGSVFHYVNCGDSMKLESCRNAAERTCPKGYASVADAYSPDPSDPALQCAQDNKERQVNREPPRQCPTPKNKDNYFVCK